MRRALAVFHIIDSTVDLKCTDPYFFLLNVSAMNEKTPVNA